MSSHKGISAALIKMLETENDDEVWEQVVLLLGARGDSSAVAPLIARLKMGGRQTGTLAAKALGDIRDPQAVDALIYELTRGYSSVRAEAAHALGRIGDARAVEPLLALCRETEVNDVRIAAVKALERIGYEPHNDRERVAFYVAKGDTDALVKMGDPALELLMKTALDEPAESCEWAIAALCRIPGSKALARLQELLAPRHTPRIRQEILLQLLQSGREDIDPGELAVSYLKDEELGYLAAKGLVRIGGRKYLSALIDYLLNIHWGQTEIVTSLGNTLLEGSNIFSSDRDAILQCMRQLASGGNEEAAAILYRLRTGI